MNFTSNFKKLLAFAVIICSFYYATAMPIGSINEIPIGQNDEYKVENLWNTQIQSFLRDGESRLANLKKNQ